MPREQIPDTMAPDLIPDPLDQSCGWCGRSAWLRRRAAVQAGFEFFGGSDQRPRIAGLYECSGCHRPSLAIFQAYHVSGWRTSLLLVIPEMQAFDTHSGA
jgi:hypothetical protein